MSREPGPARLPAGFWRVLASQGTSLTGNGIQQIALPLWVLHRTGSAVSAGIAFATQWRGDLVILERTGLQCRIGVQHVLAPQLSDPASLAVLAAHLDGPNGLVQRRLRAEAGLVYGGVALPREDGGTLLLIPACLRDPRRWHWQRPAAPLPPALRGSAYAAHLALRVQVCVIYAWAAVAKLGVPEWRDGTALYYVVHDAYYGATPVLRDLVGPALGWRPLLAAATWSVILLELALALAALGNRRSRRLAVALAVVLHGGIVLFLGLFSFGLVMIATVLLLAADHPPA